MCFLVAFTARRIDYLEVMNMNKYFSLIFLTNSKTSKIFLVLLKVFLSPLITVDVTDDENDYPGWLWSTAREELSQKQKSDESSLCDPSRLKYSCIEMSYRHMLAEQAFLLDRDLIHAVHKILRALYMVRLDQTKIWNNSSGKIGEIIRKASTKLNLKAKKIRLDLAWSRELVTRESRLRKENASHTTSDSNEARPVRFPAASASFECEIYGETRGAGRFFKLKKKKWSNWKLSDS